METRALISFEGNEATIEMILINETYYFSNKEDLLSKIIDLYIDNQITREEFIKFQEQALLSNLPEVTDHVILKLIEELNRILLSISKIFTKAILRYRKNKNNRIHTNCYIKDKVNQDLKFDFMFKEDGIEIIKFLLKNQEISLRNYLFLKEKINLLKIPKSEREN